MNKFLILIVSILFLNLSLEAQNIKLVFRYDDFILNSDSLNEEVVKTFQKHHIPLVLGVIPCNSGENLVLQNNYPFLPALKNAVDNHSIEIALHGLNHQKIANGEFVNVDKSEQYRRMLTAKSLLDSIFNIKVITFIPPWNAYDDNTLVVMQQLGLKVISSGLWVGQAFSNDSISYFPYTVADLNQLPCVLSQNKNRDGIIVVMFHPYDFDKLYSLTKLDGLLSNMEKMKNVRCFSFKQLYLMHETSDQKRMQSNLESNLLSKYLHLSQMIQTSFFAILIRLLNMMLYVFISVCVYLLSLFIVYRKRRNPINHVYLFGLLFLGIVIISVWFHIIAPLKLLILSIVLAALLPIALYLKYKN
jgi:peptidoglycan/xylan/chitin deacetylase (PgdA/CDA1 family)